MINRINTEAIKETITHMKKYRSSSVKKLKIEGNWRLDEQSGPQFETKLKTEKAGAILVQFDEALFLGGGGSAPSPFQYYIGGLLARYSATFVTWASLEGIQLTSFKIKGIATIDLSGALGLSDNPHVNDLHVELFIERDAPIEKLLEINEITKKTCPGYYCFTHEIHTEIDIQKNEF